MSDHKLQLTEPAPLSSLHPFLDWLETHWVAPATSGGLLIVFAICFFGAATNTMAGWLYVLSGVMIALLLISIITPIRSLKQLYLRRLPITPVSAGEDLTLELMVDNPTAYPKTLLQVADHLPFVLTPHPSTTAIEVIPPHGQQRWLYYISTHQRGIYRWHDVALKSGNPFGLFWCRRYRQLPAKAIVYPQILPLVQCPLLDTIGQEENPSLHSDRHYQAATEGMTKTLRPYRYGDSTRLIHWRTSARFDDFKVRELEVITGGQDVIICLDTRSPWAENAFEQAVIAAASLYFYAHHSQLNVKLWTAENGLIWGQPQVLETLAGVMPQATEKTSDLPTLPVIWLTGSSSVPSDLPRGSRGVVFPCASQMTSVTGMAERLPCLVIDLQQPLQLQLQNSLR